MKGEDNALAKSAIEFHQNRLRDTINDINSQKSPTDAHSLLRGLRVWTSLRGKFHDGIRSHQAFTSYEKWFYHLNGGHTLGRYRHIPGGWVSLSISAGRLQNRINLDRAHNRLPDISYLDVFKKEIRGTLLSLREPEIEKLVELIVGARNEERYIQGPTYPSETSEHSTFPKAVSGNFALTPVLLDSPVKPAVAEPMLPADLMCAPLGVPTLPGAPGTPYKNTFCYHLNNKSAYKALAKGHTIADRVLTPRTIANILECVEVW